MNKSFALLGTLITLFVTSVVVAETRFSIHDLRYKGAMRFQDVAFGESRLGYANGVIAISNDRNSVYIVGHDHHQAIAEYELLEFSLASNLSEVPMARQVQPFTRILDRAPSGNPEGIGVITGMSVINQKLVVNAAGYYDAGASNTDTTLILDDISDLGGSEITGYLKIENAVRASGWITPIPMSLQHRFDADYITGFASNLPINARSSMGPSAYAIDSETLLNSKTQDTIPVIELLSYSIHNQLHEDHYNNSLENDLWTEVSSAFTGFIVPGTNTYAVFGNSAGHHSGLGYKITQDNGRLCGGGCPYQAADRYNFYWLYDIDDLIQVKNGSMEPHSVMPFEYGPIVLPFEQHDGLSLPALISGAYYEHESQTLYLLLSGADTLRQSEALPVLLKYEIVVGRRPSAPSNVVVIRK